MSSVQAVRSRVTDLVTQLLFGPGGLTPWVVVVPKQGDSLLLSQVESVEDLEGNNVNCEAFVLPPDGWLAGIQVGSDPRCDLWTIDVRNYFLWISSISFQR